MGRGAKGLKISTPGIQLKGSQGVEVPLSARGGAGGRGGGGGG